MWSACSCLTALLTACALNASAAETRAWQPYNTVVETILQCSTWVRADSCTDSAAAAILQLCKVSLRRSFDVFLGHHSVVPSQGMGILWSFVAERECTQDPTQQDIEPYLRLASSTLCNRQLPASNA